MPGILDFLSQLAPQGQQEQPQQPQTQQQQQPLTYRDLYSYLHRDPILSQMYTPQQNFQQPGYPWNSNEGFMRAMRENMTTGSPAIMGQLGLQRLMGIDLSPRNRIDETFGLMRGNPSLSTAFGNR